MTAGISVHPATPDRWDDLAAVMGQRGDPSHCWCQFFKLRGKTWESSTRSANRAALRQQVHDEPVSPGVMAYTGDEAVGWCAVAPTSSYPRLLASPTAGPDAEGRWAISCFVVRVGWRRRGIATALVSEAVALAAANGASTVEGYPVDPVARRSVSSAELYHGTLSLFLDAGFAEVARPSAARAVVRLEL